MFIAALSTLVRWQGLEASLLSDDWDQYAMEKRAYPVARSPWDYYTFVGKGADERAALVRAGRLPWWAAGDLELAMFRPLSSVLLHFDYATANGGRAAARAHWHSLLWWLLLMAGSAALLYRLLPCRAAALAMAVYALDDAFVYPVAWPANRAQLVAVTCVVWAAWAHLYSCERDRGAGLRVAAWCLTALGVFAGEHAFAPLVVFAALLFEPPRVRSIKRALVVFPYLVPIAAYLILRVVLDYRVIGSEYYVDPFREPVRYLTEAAERIPLLAGDLLFGIPAEWWLWGPTGRSGGLLRSVVTERPTLQLIQLGLGGLACGLVGVAIVVLLRRRERTHRRLGRLWFAAMVSLTLLCGTAAMSRLTLAPALVFAAAFGSLIDRELRAAGRATAPMLRRLVGMVLATSVVVLQLVVPGIASYEGARNFAASSRVDRDWIAASTLGSQTDASRHVFIIAARDMATQFCLPYVLEFLGRSAPRTSHLLSPSAQSPQLVRRIRDNVLEIAVSATAWPFGPAAYRRADDAFRVGDLFDTGLFVVEVRATEHGVPTQLRFVFLRSLDDPAYVFVYPREAGLTELVLPRVGQSVRLPPPVWPHPSHR